jgi:hypothetical protein
LKNIDIRIELKQKRILLSEHVQIVDSHLGIEPSQVPPVQKRRHTPLQIGGRADREWSPHFGRETPWCSPLRPAKDRMLTANSTIHCMWDYHSTNEHWTQISLYQSQSYNYTINPSLQCRQITWGTCMTATDESLMHEAKYGACRGTLFHLTQTKPQYTHQVRLCQLIQKNTIMYVLVLEYLNGIMWEKEAIKLPTDA